MFKQMKSIGTFPRAKLPYSCTASILNIKFNLAISTNKLRWLLPFFMMNFCVFRPANNFKISNSIVQFISIFMVNQFIGLKISINKFFHYFSMFKNVASILYEKLISIWCNISSSNFPPFPNLRISIEPKPSIVFRTKSILSIRGIIG